MFDVAAIAAGLSAEQQNGAQERRDEEVIE